MRDDSPVNIKGWTPENYDRGYRGADHPARGLALSLNTVAVKLDLEVGPEGRGANGAAPRHHLAAPGQPGSLALGTSEVTPLELVSAYAAFANGGFGVVPYVITAGEDRPMASSSISRPTAAVWAASSIQARRR